MPPSTSTKKQEEKRTTPRATPKHKPQRPHPQTRRNRRPRSSGQLLLRRMEGRVPAGEEHFADDEGEGEEPPPERPRKGRLTITYSHDPLELTSSSSEGEEDDLTSPAKYHQLMLNLALMVKAMRRMGAFDWEEEEGAGAEDKGEEAKGPTTLVTPGVAKELNTTPPPLPPPPASQEGAGGSGRRRTPAPPCYKAPRTSRAPSEECIPLQPLLPRKKSSQRVTFAPIPQQH